MSNTQALYDVERQKTVKNVPLLKKLQAQICEVISKQRRKKNGQSTNTSLYGLRSLMKMSSMNKLHKILSQTTPTTILKKSLKLQ
jgi:hypothetical protein